MQRSEGRPFRGFLLGRVVREHDIRQDVVPRPMLDVYVHGQYADEGVVETLGQAIHSFEDGRRLAVKAVPLSVI